MADPNAYAVVVAVPETWHVNPYHRKFNPSTKVGQVIFEKKSKGLPGDERFNAQRNIPSKFVAYYKRNLHRWAQWLLESRNNMMPRSM